jgi:hypothetical protein
MGMFTVFISHSERNDPEATRLVDRLREELPKHDFHPIVDRDELVHGRPWRNRINTWTERCHGSVVVLSQKALASTFVAYEATLLCRRRRRNPNFLVQPVFLPGVTFDSVQKSPLAPTQIEELHPIFWQAEFENTISLIVESLKTAKVCAYEPDDQVLKVISLLQQADPAKIAKAARLLDVDLGPLDPVEDEFQSIALKLMSVGLEKASAAIDAMKGKWDETDLETLFRLVACSWVDSCSGDLISEKVREPDFALRSMALGTGYQRTAELYVLKASKRPPDLTGQESAGWETACVHNIEGEQKLDDPQVLENLAGKVEKALEAALGADEGELAQYLHVWNRKQIPVFVTLRTPAVTKKLIEKLKSKFGPVTLLFLTGTEVSGVALAGCGVDVVRPELHPDDDTAFNDQYDENWIFVKPKHKQVS